MEKMPSEVYSAKSGIEWVGIEWVGGDIEHLMVLICTTHMQKKAGKGQA